MRKPVLMGLLLITANVVHAGDIYLCDGFKSDNKTKEKTAIPNAKFEIEHSVLGIEIKNKSTNKKWHAFKKVKDDFYQNGNVLLGMQKKSGDTKFIYMNVENNQTVVFMNCVVPDEF